MANKQNDSDAFKAPLPKTKRLNRNLIMLLVAIVLIVVIYIFIEALSEPQTSQQKAGQITANKSVVSKDTTKISALPDSYGDGAKINAILGRNKPQAQIKIPQSIKNQIASLQSQQQALQNKIAQMKAKPTEPVQPTYSENDHQAMTSAIFIAGGAPRVKSNTVKSKAAKKSSTSKLKDSVKQSSYEQQNMQNQKSSFLDTKPDKSIYNNHTIQYPVSKFIIQAGAVIPAVLQSTIVSNLPGLITAVVNQNVYDSINGQYLLIPKGSRLIGQYNSKVSYGQDQLQAVFTRLVRPDGTSIVLPGKSAGVNPMGVSGFEDEVNNHWGRILGSAALITLFNIPAIIAQNQMNQGVGYNPYNVDSTYAGGGYSLGHNASTAALQSVGQAVSKIGTNIADKSLNIQPTITINSGYQFSVMVTKDIVLPPFQQQFEHIPELAG